MKTGQIVSNTFKQSDVDGNKAGWSLLGSCIKLWFLFKQFRDGWIRGTFSSPIDPALSAAKILEYALFDPENLLVDISDYCRECYFVICYH